jgi:hypothetical protein
MRLCTVVAAWLAVMSLWVAYPFGKKATSRNLQDNVDLQIGKTTQKYHVEYQSSKEKKKRIYRVRNTPGGVLVAVLWKHENETLFDFYIPKCSGDMKVCEWIVSSVMRGEPEEGKTVLSYGSVNDEFSDQPTAFKKKAACGEPECEGQAELPPLQTTIKGKIADAEGNTYALDLVVTSTATMDKGFYKMQYTLAQTLGDPAQLVLKSEVPMANKSIHVIWESAHSAEFEQEAKKLKERMIGDTKNQLQVVIGSKTIEVNEGLLIIKAGSKRLGSITAPAYKPKG